MIENISNLFGFVGGLGMFLYGMHIMAEGMQKTAGGKMQKFLGMITNNRVTAIMLGALITAIIQSSGATTVMVVGFVNAGIMTLLQAVGVIMGANIGTTITAWIVSMSEIGSNIEVLKPDFYAPLLIGLGAIALIFTKSEKKHIIGEISIGLGFLFVGLSLMSGSISPYTDLPIFSDAFRVLGSNPLLGMLVGCLVTALLQSSSASVGILQTLAMNGVVSTNAAIYITLGQNIGSCVTALISSAGSNRTAKRAAVIHLSFNIIGSIIFGIMGFIIFSINKEFAASDINSVQISIFHTVFNLTNTILLFPFANQLVALSGMVVPGRDEIQTQENDEISALRHLDARIFETPAFALETGIHEVLNMGALAVQNVRRVIDAIYAADDSAVAEVFATEKKINNMQTVITEYLIKVDNLAINEKQKLILNNLFYSLNDIERVGDHAENIAENIQYLKVRDLQFSDTAIEDLRRIGETAYEAFATAIKARETGDMAAVVEVNRYEDEVDYLQTELREKHIERLAKGKCTPAAGIIFIDMVSNLERISDHAKNLSEYISKEI